MPNWFWYSLLLLIAVLLAWPAIWKVMVYLANSISFWWSGVLERRQRRLGRWPYAEAPTCPKCGYDLRSSPERCPECGEPLPPMESIIVHYLMRLRFGQAPRTDQTSHRRRPEDRENHGRLGRT